MKTLTVKQPWAWGLIHGPKRVENRTRQIHHRGPLAIHAGKSRAELAADYKSLFPDLPPPDGLAFGAIIGVVDLIDCKPAWAVKDMPFASGPWCWIVADPRPLVEPLPWRGSLALQEIPDELILPRLRVVGR